MRQRAWRGFLAGLGLWLWALPAAAGERDTYESAKSLAAAKKEKSGGSWWWPWGDSELKKEISKKEKERAEAQARKPRPAPLQSAVEQPLMVAQENADYLRRLQACDRLRAIAQETGDQALEIQAQLLEQRAWTLYEQRTAFTRTGTPPPLAVDGAYAARKLLQETPPVAQTRTGDRPLRSISARGGSPAGGQEE